MEMKRGIEGVRLKSRIQGSSPRASPSPPRARYLLLFPLARYRDSRRRVLPAKRDRSARSLSSHCLEIRDRRDRRRYTLQPPLAPSPFFTVPRSFLLVPRASPASAPSLFLFSCAPRTHTPPSSFPCTQFVPFGAGTQREFHLEIASSASLLPPPPATATLGDRLDREGPFGTRSVVPPTFDASNRVFTDDRCLHFLCFQRRIPQSRLQPHPRCSGSHSLEMIGR